MKLFFSYGHDRNADIVTRLKAALEAHGHLVWLDEEAIREAHAQGPDAAEAREAAPALTDRVVVSPPDDGGGPPEVELVGNLNTMFHATNADPRVGKPNATQNATLDTFIHSIKETPTTTMVPPLLSRWARPFVRFHLVGGKGHA